MAGQMNQFHVLPSPGNRPRVDLFANDTRAQLPLSATDKPATPACTGRVFSRFQQADYFPLTIQLACTRLFCLISRANPGGIMGTDAVDPRSGCIKKSRCGSTRDDCLSPSPFQPHKDTRSSGTMVLGTAPGQRACCSLPSLALLPCSPAVG